MKKFYYLIIACWTLTSLANPGLRRYRSESDLAKLEANNAQQRRIENLVECFGRVSQQLQKTKQAFTATSKDLVKTTRGLKRAEEDLQETKQKLLIMQQRETDVEERTAALKNASHDALSGVATAYSALQLLKDSIENPEDELLTETERHLDMSLRIMKDALGSQEELHEDWFDIKELLEGIAKFTENKIEATGKAQSIFVTIHPSIEFEESDTLKLLGDQGKLARVLNNLAGNAAQYVGQGRIQLIATKLPALPDDSIRVKFAVKDNGCGISLKNQKKIFRLGQRGTDEGAGGNHGLGLYTVKKLVTQMGGEIELESEVGRGSIFSFVLLMKTRDTPALLAADE